MFLLWLVSQSQTSHEKRSLCLASASPAKGARGEAREERRLLLDNVFIGAL